MDQKGEWPGQVPPHPTRSAGCWAKGGPRSIYNAIPLKNLRKNILQKISFLKKLYGNYLHNDPRSKGKGQKRKKCFCEISTEYKIYKIFPSKKYI